MHQCVIGYRPTVFYFWK